MHRVVALFLSPVLLIAVLGPANKPRLARGSELSPYLAKIRDVGKQGQGHAAAMAAYREVARADVAQIPEILAGFEGAGPLAENWLRAAVDTIAERQLAGERVTMPQIE